MPSSSYLFHHLMKMKNFHHLFLSFSYFPAILLVRIKKRRRCCTFVRSSAHGLSEGVVGVVGGDGDVRGSVEPGALVLHRTSSQHRPVAAHAHPPPGHNVHRARRRCSPWGSTLTSSRRSNSTSTSTPTIWAAARASVHGEGHRGVVGEWC